MDKIKKYYDPNTTRIPETRRLTTNWLLEQILWTDIHQILIVTKGQKPNL